jgi:hypothetical protein
VVDYTTTGVTITGTLTVSGAISGEVASTFADGSEATPGIRYTDDTNLGRRRVGADAMADVCGGADVVDYTTAGVAVTGTLSSSVVVATVRLEPRLAPQALGSSTAR